MAKPENPRATWSSKKPIFISFGAVFLLVSILGVWAVRTNITGAVIGKGTIEASSTQTAVQHPIGGVVEEIYATNGTLVKAGDVLLRLDSHQLDSDLNIAEGDLFEALANIARLEASIDGERDMDIHPILQEHIEKRPELAYLMERQQKQLHDHYEALDVSAHLLDEQISQVVSQIEGIESQIQAKRDESLAIEEEVKKSDALNKKGLLRSSVMFSLAKNRALVRGEIGRLNAKTAELRGKISEIELKRHTIIPNERKLAEVQLSKLRPLRTRYLEKRSSVLDRLSRLEVRAPISGRVHDSKVFGVRSVVVAAKPLMMIIPDVDPSLVVVQVSVTDIDQVYSRQEASLKFKSFNGRKIPIILGEVTSISANVLKDATAKKSYYEVTVTVSQEELDKLGGRDLIPGMPVDAFLTTESRSPMQYVLEPLIGYFDRAFRDA